MVQTAEDAAEDVLPGVLLHVVKAAGPVDFAGDRGPGFHIVGAGVEHHAALLVDVRHRNLLSGGGFQDAAVRGLSAALGVEGRPVQGNFPHLPSGLAGEDRGGEGF